LGKVLGTADPERRDGLVSRDEVGLDRIQEVAGSSPASSTFERPAKRLLHKASARGFPSALGGDRLAGGGRA
jgi:hypothetical protein